MNMQQFALNLLSQNPNIKSNPRFQGMVDVIQSGDQQKGEQMAMNLCNSYGVSKEEMLNQARQYFGI